MSDPGEARRATTVSDPGEARRLHPLSPVLDVVRFGPQMLFLAVLGGSGRVILLVSVVVVAIVTVAVRYVAWSRSTYRIDGGSLVVERGLLNRTRTVLPLDRVQQVDLQRKLRHQVTGLAVVRIDRAGGGSQAEVVLDAVSQAEAERLRVALGAGTAAAPVRSTLDDGEAQIDVPIDSTDGSTVGSRARTDEEEPERVVIALGLRDVALAGVTGAKLLVVFAALSAAASTIDEVARDSVTDTVTRWVEDGARPGTVVTVVVAVIGIPVWLAVAAGASVLADGGFRLTRRGDRLRVTRGVLDQREASLAIPRIQVVRVHENALRRALGLVSVSLQSAGGSGSVEGSSTRVTVPLLRRTQLDALLAEVLPQVPSLPSLAPAPPAARRRAWVRRVVPALVVAVPLAVLAFPTGLIALVLPVLAAAAGELVYRALGWATVDGYVIARQGGLAREVALVPVAKAQSTRLRSSPFQRRAGLATLLVDVAGRGRTPTVVDGDVVALARLRHAALDTSAARRDEAAIRRRAHQEVVVDSRHVSSG